MVIHTDTDVGTNPTILVVDKTLAAHRTLVETLTMDRASAMSNVSTIIATLAGTQ